MKSTTSAEFIIVDFFELHEWFRIFLCTIPLKVDYKVIVLTCYALHKYIRKKFKACFHIEDLDVKDIEKKCYC